MSKHHDEGNIVSKVLSAGVIVVIVATALTTLVPTNSPIRATAMQIITELAASVKTKVGGN